MSSTVPPPFYILVSPTSAQGQLHTTLQHPTIQLHYADDPPTALLPTTETPNILILEPHIPSLVASPPPQEPHLQSSSPPAISISSAATITPSAIKPDSPAVQSLSGTYAVTSVRVAQPPAAAVAYAASHGQDPNIYIIDYAPIREDTQRLENSVRERSTIALLAQFHQRNALLRSVLDAPNPRQSLPAGGGSL